MTDVGEYQADAGSEHADADKITDIHEVSNAVRRSDWPHPSRHPHQHLAI